MHAPNAGAPFTSWEWAIRGPWRAQAARLLRRRQLTLAGRLALRRVVHLHTCERWWTGLVRGGCQAISECCWAISAGLVLRARAHTRDSVRRRAIAHRHGRGDLVVDGGLDRFHWRLVRPLGFRDGGRHLAQWHLLDTSRYLMTRRGRGRSNHWVPEQSLRDRASNHRACNRLVCNSCGRRGEKRKKRRLSYSTDTAE